MSEALSVEEFERWERWPLAYQRIEAMLGECTRDEFRHRLVTGSLRAAAREVKFQSQVEENETWSPGLISPYMWKFSRGISDTEVIWHTASIALSDMEDFDVVSCHGIRLEPIGLDQILIDAGLLETSPIANPVQILVATTIKRPDVSQAQLEAWHRGFIAQHPNGSKKLAEKLAVDSFPDHNVARQRVRDLFPDRTMGRPRKTRT